MTSEEKIKSNYNATVKSNDILILDDDGFDVSLFETYLIDKTKFKTKSEMFDCALRLLTINQNINRLNHNTKEYKNDSKMVEGINILVGETKN
jgi:hypothetical protein